MERCKAASKSMAHLDETGLEVAGCQHGIPIKLVCKSVQVAKNSSPVLPCLEQLQDNC